MRRRAPHGLGHFKLVKQLVFGIFERGKLIIVEFNKLVVLDEFDKLVVVLVQFDKLVVGRRGKWRRWFGNGDFR